MLGLCECGTYVYGQEEITSLEDFLKNLVTKNIICSQALEIGGVTVKPVFYPDRIKLQITVWGRYGDDTFEKELSSVAIVKKRVCPTCAKIRAKYYEAILQVRTRKAEPELDINPRYVSDVKTVRGGFDFYLTSTDYGRSVEKSFRSLGYITRESSKVYGRKDGRDVYRISILVREPFFSEGDTILYEGRLLYVLKRGKRTLCRDLKAMQKRHVDAVRLESGELIANSSDLKDAVVTMSSPYEVQIFVFDENQTYEIKKGKREFEPGSELKVLILDSRVYMP